MDISFIIVNYKSEDLLERCISSIYKYAPETLSEIIIINNDASPLKNFTNDSRIKIIENHENIGFAKACNLGAEIATGKNLFFLNPDTEIQTSAKEIFQTLDEPGIGIAAPCLITPLGDIEPWSSGNEITAFNIIINNLLPVKKQRLMQNTKEFIDWTSGAALAISKKLFTECGGFDENFFMYFEDVDLCRRVGRLDKKIVLLPNVKILHYSGQSATDKKQQKQQYYASQDYYLKKHFGAVSVYIIKLLRSIGLFFKSTD